MSNKLPTFNKLRRARRTQSNASNRFSTASAIGIIALLAVQPLFAAQDITEYQYRIVKTYPHSRQVFTQGLEFHNNQLYESAGLRGRSSVLIRSLDSLTPLRRYRLDKQLFAEGITLINNRLYQLTWKSGRVFVYHADTLEPDSEFKLSGEGWGLTNNGNELIASNGSNRLFFLHPVTGAITKTVHVTLEGRALGRLNELEWINGAIYANIWQSNWIVIIDPDSGLVTGKVNLNGLLPKHLYTASTDVLNGIAYDRSNDRLFVTGKNWPKLYHIQLSEVVNFDQNPMQQSTQRSTKPAPTQTK